MNFSKTRFCRCAGVWRSLSLAACLLVSTISLRAQPVDAAEYFFDEDPGVGNGIAMTVSAPGETATFSEAISTTGLAGGRHYLFIRTRTSDGLWSLSEPREFFIQVPFTDAEYFFDTDPGVGHGTPVPMSSNPDDFTFLTTIPVPTSPGRHYLFIRTLSSDGLYSLSEPREFFVQAPITTAEYFFNTDPGVGLATPLSISTTPDDYTLTTSIILPLSLLDGTHRLFIRALDESGAWSLYEPVTFAVSSVVPIELLHFKAQREGSSVQLSWVTASETNNEYFAVERWIREGPYTDKSFTTIGTVQGKGTTTMENRYQYLDHPPDGESTLYYRLRQVDFDGKETYSQVVAIGSDPGNPVIKLYPNPGRDYFTMYVEGKDGAYYSIEILDASGRSVETREKLSGKVVFGKDFSPGLYVIRIFQEGEMLVVKVVKE